MTPHISGTSLSAQARYAAGTREILDVSKDRLEAPPGSCASIFRRNRSPADPSYLDPRTK
jgi:hypothetical protein